MRQRIIQDGHLLNDSFKTIADAEWIFRLITRGYRTAVLPVPLATFMQTGSNMGQSPAGLEESRRWRAHKGVIGRGIAAGHGALHRVRKVLAGCYRKRHVAIQIHMPGHTERQSVKATIGGTWSEN